MSVICLGLFINIILFVNYFGFICKWNIELFLLIINLEEGKYFFMLLKGFSLINMFIINYMD